MRFRKARENGDPAGLDAVGGVELRIDDLLPLEPVGLRREGGGESISQAPKMVDSRKYLGPARDAMAAETARLLIMLQGAAELPG